MIRHLYKWVHLIINRPTNKIFWLETFSISNALYGQSYVSAKSALACFYYQLLFKIKNLDNFDAGFTVHILYFLLVIIEDRQG